ncbi:hypothetical protein STEG23_024388, partial [Scotinomys teguina]
MSRWRSVHYFTRCDKTSGKSTLSGESFLSAHSFSARHDGNIAKIWQWRFPHHDLDALAHRIPFLSLRLDSWSSAWCLAVDFYIRFHQLLDGGSVMTVR